MIYTVYRTTNKRNGNFYIGVHKTRKPMDAYLGSGKYIKRAVAKYGKESFAKEILFEFDNLHEALRKEFELVALHRKDKLCINLRQGGSGGFDYINPRLTHEDRVARGKAMNLVIRERIKDDPEYARQWMEKQMGRLAKAADSFDDEAKERQREIARKTARETWTGRKHSENTKILMSKKATGASNSQFGTKWITDGFISKKIVPTELLPEGWRFGRNGQVA